MRKNRKTTKIEEVEIWHNPMAPAASIVSQVEQLMQNPPTEIDINVKLVGKGALRYALISNILEVGFGEDTDTIAKYIIRKGVEAELLKLANAIQPDNDK